MDFIYISTITVVVLFVAIAAFQLLLALGYPLGEFAMGGYYKVLPMKLRFMSVVNSFILLCMGFIFLQHSQLVIGFEFLSTTILVWVITIFLGLNTIINVISRSKKERFVMTPLSGFTFFLCLYIAIS